MSVFKNVHMKFWQNDFVLGLTAEERYFYIYLITNSMTNQCGIYKFNRKLAELETGYSCDEIETYLKKFEEYGKVIVSRSSIEIMLVNWFKHNFKVNKKILLSINKELKDVKDKELLKRLYDFCSERQYPIDEIFSGVIFPNNEVEKVIVIEKNQEEVTLRIEENKINAHEERNADMSLVCEESKNQKEPLETNPILINKVINNDDYLIKDDISEVNGAEEALITDDCMEEDIVDGTTIISWSFSDT